MRASAPLLPSGPLSGLDDATLAELFALVYTGYSMPVHADAALMRFMRIAFDWDLAASRALLDAGTPVAIALLAHRGDAGWIGGMGVAPSHRGRGLGAAVMREVIASGRALGLARIGLEVLVENAPAIRVYEALDFRTTRDLDVWGFPAPERADDGLALEPVPFADAMAFVAAHRAAPEPWQRSAGTVAALAADGLAIEGLLAKRGGRTVGGMVFRAAGRASVLQLAVTPEEGDRALRALLAALRRDDAPQGVRWLNLPSGDPAAPFVRSLSPTLEARQFEMELAL